MRSLLLNRLAVAFALLLLGAFVFAGCGGDDAGTSGQTQTSALPTTSTNSADDPADSKDAEKSADGDDHSEEDGSHPEIPLRPNVNDREGSKGGSNGQMGEVTPVDNIYSAATSETKVSSPEVRVYQDDGSFAKLKTKQFGEADAHPRELHVDFRGEEQVIAVFVPNGKVGTTLKVTKVETDGKQTQVTALLSSPKQNCGPADGVVIRPTAWVVTRTLPKRTTLKVQKKTIAC